MADQAAPFELEPLPYADDALAPCISSNTLSFHYGKHHQTYVNNLNKLVEGSDMADMSLEEIIRSTAGDADKAAVLNNAAQVWNHSFYWKSMKPGGGGEPEGDLKVRIEQDLGGADEVRKALATAGATQFGSGWAWLALDGDKLVVTKTTNADTPIAHGVHPLITVDVWEHAYYLDYQNRRPDYLADFIGKLINWDFAAENLAKAGS